MKTDINVIHLFGFIIYKQEKTNIQHCCNGIAFSDIYIQLVIQIYILSNQTNLNNCFNMILWALPMRAEIFVLKLELRDMQDFFITPL